MVGRALSARPAAADHPSRDETRLFMRTADVLQASSTPLRGAAFPSGPYHFADREYLNITYRTDPDAMRAVVPGPLEPCRCSRSWGPRTS